MKKFFVGWAVPTNGCGMHVHKLLPFILCVCFISGVVFADTFGTGSNQFDIDFVRITGDADSANGTNIGPNKLEGFTDPGYDYRMGKFEITNDQWNKFVDINGAPTGSPGSAYDESPYWTGTNVPMNIVSWYEAAQFVNWLNTSTGHQAAYKFTGTQGTKDYTLGVWSASDAGYNAANPYRNSNAYYFLPTEDEWVKAAYWNGTNLQTYATVGDTSPTQSGWNFYDNGYATNPAGPWDVGDGTEELNGTFDMMGNVWEWMESPYYSGDYSFGSDRGIRGGSYVSQDKTLRSSVRDDDIAHNDYGSLGFRVASVPEPCSLALFALAGVVMRKRS